MTAGQARRIMSAFPVVGLDALRLGNAPLVLAPHPDDESLGCGGLLATCAASGGRPAVLVVTDGAGSHPNSRRFPPDRLRTLRQDETRSAVGALGMPPDRLAFLGLADTAAPTKGRDFEAAVDAVIAAVDRWACSALLAPWRHDPHCDHVAAHLMATEAARRTGVRQLAYPVWSLALADNAPLEGGAPAGWKLDIAAHLSRKRRAIAAHQSQHAGLIDDDPTGFHLDPDFLALFDAPFETFLSNPC